MALATRITEEEAFAAIEGIVLRGENPTHQLVRTELGDRGSNPVISRFISAWFNRYGSKLHESAARTKKNEPVTKLSEQIIAASREAAEQISEAEKKRIADLDARASKLDEREAMLISREQSLQALERKQDERELAHAEWTAGLKAEAAQAREAAAAAQDRASSAERDFALVTQELAGCKERLDAAQTELSLVLAARGAGEVRITELAADLARVSAEHRATLERAQRLQASHDALEAALLHAQSEILSAAQGNAQALAAVQQQLGAGVDASIAIDQQIRGLDRQVAQVLEAVRKSDEIQQELNKVNRQLAERTAELARCSALRESSDARVATLTDQLTHLNDELAQLRATTKDSDR